MCIVTNFCKNESSELYQNHSSAFVPIMPANYRLPLTSFFMGLYAFLFCIIYIQLILILCYGHKRFSYQTVFLFSCLIWAALRMTLFSYFFNSPETQVSCFHVWEYWILYCLPVVLQFITLSLLVLYFSQAIIKCSWRDPPKVYIKYLWLVWALMVSIFIITNLVCAHMLKSHSQPLMSSTVTVAQIRVMVNDSLFVVMSIFLSWCFYKLMKVSSAVMPLESQGISSCQTKVACILTIFIYVTKACYNFFSVIYYCSSSQRSVIVSDQADLMYPVETGEYVAFGIALFMWEFLPTFIVVSYFRVKKPPPSLSASGFSSHSYKRGFFFDNPNRYDSEDDLNKSPVTNANINSSSPYRYGSLETPPHFASSYNPSFLQVPLPSSRNVHTSVAVSS